MGPDEIRNHSEAIRSTRLLLKRITAGDVTDDYVRWLNDIEVTKYLEMRFEAQTRRSVEDYVRRSLADPCTEHLGVFEQVNLRLIGTVTFNRLEIHHLSAAISFVIGHPEARGRGYGTEAVHAGTHYLLNMRGFVKIWGGYYQGNKGAERVFQKNGYKIEGKLTKKMVNYKGERVDQILVGILNENFNPDKKLLGNLN